MKTINKDLLKIKVWLFIGLIVAGCKRSANEKINTEEKVVYPEENWQKRTLKKSNIDRLKFEAALNFLKENCLEDGIEELMIIKNGYLIYAGDSVDKVHGVWSVTKSITSTLFGILQDENKISKEDYVVKQLPYLENFYPKVQYKHFLTLTSGYDAEGANNEDHLSAYGFGDASDQPWIPTLPLFEPGKAFCYWDESMNVLAHAITRLVDQPLDDFFSDKIALPLKLDTQSWYWKKWTNARGDALCGGSGCCDKQLYISARQLSKIGYLFLQNGIWENQQIVSANWIKNATGKQVDAGIALFDSPRKHIDARGCYGYNWWINGTKQDGQLLMPNTPYNTFFASGFNNNMLFVIPEWEVVLVRMGIDGNPPNKLQVYDQFFKLLNSAINSKP